MDRARPHHDEQARIAALQYRAHDLARLEHGLGGPRRQRQPPLDFLRRRQQVAGGDIDVLQLILNVRSLAMAAYMEVRMVQSSGKNLSSSALVRYDTPPVPPVPRL